MATSRIKTSSILQGFPKSRSLLAGNAFFNPVTPDVEYLVIAGGGGGSAGGGGGAGGYRTAANFSVTSGTPLTTSGTPLKQEATVASRLLPPGTPQKKSSINSSNISSSRKRNI